MLNHDLPCLITGQIQKKLVALFYPNKKGLIRPKNLLMLLSLCADYGTYSVLSPYLYLFDFDPFCEEVTDLPPLPLRDGINSNKTPTSPGLKRAAF
jgi:hypothetical protein